MMEGSPFPETVLSGRVLFIDSEGNSTPNQRASSREVLYVDFDKHFSCYYARYSVRGAMGFKTYGGQGRHLPLAHQ